MASLLKVRFVGAAVLILLATLVAIAWHLDILTAAVASTLLGSFVGLGAGLVHIPSSGRATPVEGYPRYAAVLAIPFTTVYIIFTWCRVAPNLTPNVRELSNFAACGIMSLVFVLCARKRHPPSGYVRDAVWSVGGVWLTLHILTVVYIAKHIPGELGVILIKFAVGAGLHLEGIVFAWNACLMVRRLVVLEACTSCGARRSPQLIGLMAVAFHCKMWTETIASQLEHVPTLRTVLYLTFSVLFLGIWIFYVALVTMSIWRSVRVLRREARCVRGAPRAEAAWASKVLTFELISCLIIGASTAMMWGSIVPYRLLKWYGTPCNWLLITIVIEHRADLVLNGISVAFLSGLLWQVRGPSPEELKSKKPQLHSLMSSMTKEFVDDDTDDRPREWADKVHELANRGVSLRSLLDFWVCMTERKVMPSFDPLRSTTNDVVRQAIIPLSRDTTPSGGGRALASVWADDQPMQPSCMVTHNWSNLFLNLIAGVMADALDLECYEEVSQQLFSGKEGCAALRKTLENAGVLCRVVWICAFSINQHAGICGGFGSPPGPDSPSLADWEAKCRDTVTGEPFDLCRCTQPKAFNDDPSSCEMNKFDDMMRFLHARVPDFSHTVVVDADFEVFHRAWCIAEVVESNVSGIPQRIRIHSQKMLDLHYDSLSAIDVRNCQAARLEDRDMILSSIRDVGAFNTQLQWAIFGTEGLLSKWVDGQERAALIGRIVRRARSVSTASTGSSSASSSQSSLGVGEGSWSSFSSESEA